ncbi:MAG: SUMF1/EgtB/PvdO family nonheme iron enzyme, partial [Candidatus Sumerlaeia bacterium]|nr:SUMF1/EgtB/PvdO family nonheme iron enzyme [Candidatus Sumerlaeia bacterium]
AHFMAFHLNLIEPSGVVLAIQGNPAKATSRERLAELVDRGARRVAASQSNIYSQLHRQAIGAGQDGLFVFHAASHGFHHDGIDYIVAHDTILNRVSRTAVPLNEILEDVSKAPTNRRLVLLDACRERLTTDERNLATPLTDTFFAAIAEASGQVVLTGTTAGGFAFDDDARQNGVFTAALIEGLAGGAPGDQRGMITAGLLADFVDDHVRSWVEANRPDRSATSRGIGRQIDGPGGSLPLAMDPRAAMAHVEMMQRLDRAREKLEGLTMVEMRILGRDNLDGMLAALDGHPSEELMELVGLVEELDPNRRLDLQGLAGYYQRSVHFHETSSTNVIPPAPTIDPTPRAESELDRIQREARERQQVLDAAQAAFEMVSGLEETDVLNHTRKADAWAAYIQEHEDAGHRLAHARERERYWREWTAPTPTPTASPSPTPSPTPAGPAVSRPGTRDGERATITVNGVEFAFRWIPPGNFTMGSPSNESGRFNDEGPQTRVTFSRGFWMGETPVTQAQWKAVMGSDPENLTFPGNPNNPVERVSWNDIMGSQSGNRPTPQSGSFMARLNAASGLSFTLPTEAQWEYACRAGTTTRYFFGDNENQLGQYAWFGGNSNSRTQPVKQKQPNPWGLYDMHGNVWEWCLDWFSDKLPGGNVTDPVGPSSGSGRVVRGGSWINSALYCRSAIRFRDTPSNRNFSSGFRLALAVQ